MLQCVSHVMGAALVSSHIPGGTTIFVHHYFPLKNETKRETMNGMKIEKARVLETVLVIFPLLPLNSHCS